MSQTKQDGGISQIKLNSTQVHKHCDHDSVKGNERPFCGGERKATQRARYSSPRKVTKIRDVSKVATIKEKLDMKMTLHQGCKSAHVCTSQISVQVQDADLRQARLERPPLGVYCSTSRRHKNRRIKWCPERRRENQ